MRVVLIHGMTNSARAFDRLTPLLDGMDVTAVDLPGHGSKHRIPCPAAIEDMAAAVLDEVPLPAVVLGHSLGGHVATAIAECHPDLVHHLVLVNSPPTLESRLGARRLGERVLRNQFTGQAMWPLMPRFVVRAGLRTGFAPGFPIPEVFVNDLRRLRWLTYSRATIAADTFLAEATLHTRVAELSTPVTVVFGTQDRRVDPASLAGYDGGTTEVVTIAESGHSAPWETPERLAAVLRLVTGDLTPEA